MSFKHQITIVTGIIDSDYQGIINVLLHNHSEQPYELDPKKAMAQLLFIPISQLPIMEVNSLSQTECSSEGFGSTDCVAMISKCNSAGDHCRLTSRNYIPRRATI